MLLERTNLTVPKSMHISQGGGGGGGGAHVWPCYQTPSRIFRKGCGHETSYEAVLCKVGRQKFLVTAPFIGTLCLFTRVRTRFIFIFHSGKNALSVYSLLMRISNSMIKSLAYFILAIFGEYLAVVIKHVHGIQPVITIDSSSSGSGHTKFV